MKASIVKVQERANNVANGILQMHLIGTENDTERLKALSEAYRLLQSHYVLARTESRSLWERIDAQGK